ncbi:hypothetical protein [Paenibacillus sp. NPDC058174]|uniref:hypothetical protein n=1 Tax=Paenibacillus sp. NPDC058174 TaxID=3346366 RepID=UPI0036D784BF
MTCAAIQPEIGRRSGWRHQKKAKDRAGTVQNVKVHFDLPQTAENHAQNAKVHLKSLETLLFVHFWPINLHIYILKQ